jgi:SPOR domain
MYDTRWPRPGPAMAAVAAVLGLVAGAILGLSSPGAQPRVQAESAPVTSAAPTTRTLPDNFYTVVLASEHDRADALAAQARFRRLGVRDAGVLGRTEFPQLGTAYAVYSGLFASLEKAEAYEAELEQRGGLGDPFTRHLTN